MDVVAWRKEGMCVQMKWPISSLTKPQDSEISPSLNGRGTPSERLAFLLHWRLPAQYLIPGALTLSPQI